MCGRRGGQSWKIPARLNSILRVGGGEDIGNECQAVLNVCLSVITLAGLAGTAEPTPTGPVWLQVGGEERVRGENLNGVGFGYAAVRRGN